MAGNPSWELDLRSLTETEGVLCSDRGVLWRHGRALKYLDVGAVRWHELLVDVGSSFPHVALWRVDAASAANLPPRQRGIRPWTIPLCRSLCFQKHTLAADNVPGKLIILTYEWETTPLTIFHLQIFRHLIIMMATYELYPYTSRNHYNHPGVYRAIVFVFCIQIYFLSFKYLDFVVRY